MTKIVIEEMDLFNNTWDLLKSSKYPCPGGHYENGLSSSAVEDMAIEAGIDLDEIFAAEWEGKPKWIREGECKEQLDISEEYEYDEYGGSSFSYPVVEESDCATALGFTNEDDTLYTHPSQVFGMYRERARLQEAFCKMARQMQIRRVRE